MDQGGGTSTEAGPCLPSLERFQCLETRVASLYNSGDILYSMCRTLFSQLYSSVVLRWTPCFPFPYLSPFQYFLLPLLVSNIFSSQALLPLSLSDSALGKVRTIYSHSGMNDQQDKVLAGMGKGRLYL